MRKFYEKPDVCEGLLPTDYSPDDDNIPVRTSDYVVNDRGRKLIVLCKICNMRIVNGRIGKDANVGARTCVTYNRSSTED